MGLFTYDVNRYSAGKMIIIPMIILAISLISVGLTFLSTGMPVTPGIDFSGGTSVTIYTTDSPEQVTSLVAGYPLVGKPVQGQGSIDLRFGAMDDTMSQSLVTLLQSRYAELKIDRIGESFAKNLQPLALEALIFSFIGMSIVVFVTFRTFVPSAAVILSAFADIVMTAMAMNFLGFQLSLGTTAALLMLIGYSVDSDILLTMRVFKRQGKLEEKLAGAFHTGIIMTSTTFGAVAAMWAVAYLGHVTIIFEIASVLLLGLIFDIMNTWLTNVAIIKWYVEKGATR
ncbi:MAG: protein translocase subunit SecF [Methanoregulaceae archaeon]|nr:protein translocase subunit SecF [Methanoregulaceae archaeon]